MPLYNTATTAAALHVSPKWLDNLLSHNKIDGVLSERQGVARRLSLPAIELVAVVQKLVSSLDLPASSAVRIAQQLLHDPGRQYHVSPALTLSLDLHSLRQEVADSLAHAVEIAPHPQRGRPRR